ncbi:DUF2309 domain-containing protein [Flavihumibacter sp. UBA7668]|uniref:DUF2309 domain-containing protein n=1 Tax=Flavihumibacter sp. UBA7668 TaxID=1946542 RepID=UPI0025C275C4|nr:DUF2309 domain-containing protein [Flavihumibacter sp. UBA7668]
MLTTTLKQEPTLAFQPASQPTLEQAIRKSWSKIAPFWPLKNLLAVNPLAGFEDLHFEEGLQQGAAYFQQPELPVGMQLVNRASIKWLQAYFDEGQATIRMPHRTQGFLKSTLSLFRFDQQLHQNNPQPIEWLRQLPQKPIALIDEALSFLTINREEQEEFLTLLLTTLPGWAAHIQYRTNWADKQDAHHPHPVSQIEYLAFRLVLTCLLWPEAKDILRWHANALQKTDTTDFYGSILQNETAYQQSLLKQLGINRLPQQKIPPRAQLVFCIDVRSEPFRRALEAQGDYETYGFAGFFGVPVSVENSVTAESYASCPVLLKPVCSVEEKPVGSTSAYRKGQENIRGIKKLYQSVKYTFTTPFSLVEALGLASGLWMGLRTFSPKGAASLQSSVQQLLAPQVAVRPVIDSIPLEQQVQFAGGALKLMGLTENFAPLVVFCGHGSETVNNAYASALDCGACGGRHGAPNAQILADILNNPSVREELQKQAIAIPADTHFIAAEHITTTDEVRLYHEQLPDTLAEQLLELQNDLEKAGKLNSRWRIAEMDPTTTGEQASNQTALRAKDWAQVRPEWGLARNAAFIAGPRWLTKAINLDGRSFLHSYEWEKDTDGSSLTTILTAPMVVAQWINAQYLFSTMDNVAFGGGSKITKNITGKIGIMQGNASDLMHGLPLQSVYKSDTEPYHQPMRLTTIVYAPTSRIDRIIREQPILQKLFGNAWVHLICYDPQNEAYYHLNEDLTWTSIVL